MKESRFDIIRSVYSNQKSYLGKRPLPMEEVPISELISDLFCPGPYYYYVIDSPSLTFDFVSPSVEAILGYNSSSFQLEDLVDIVHPEDFQFVKRCEARVAEFIVQKIQPKEIFDYKYCYTFRQRTKAGIYRRFLMQTTVLRTEDEGALLKVFGVQTDITELEVFNTRNLQFVHLNGGKSFCINDVWEGGLNQKSLDLLSLTKRELEVASNLSVGLTSSSIAHILNISEETVISHRKSMLKKTKSKNATELIARLIRSGII